MPQALLHNLKHNQVLHRRNVILTVVFQQVPWVSEAERVEVEKISPSFWQIRLNFGFMNTPDVPKALTLCKNFGIEFSYSSVDHLRAS